MSDEMAAALAASAPASVGPLQYGAAGAGSRLSRWAFRMCASLKIVLQRSQTACFRLIFRWGKAPHPFRTPTGTLFAYQAE